MKRARQAVLIVYVIGLCGIAGFLTPWQVVTSHVDTGRLIPITHAYGSLFDPPANTPTKVDVETSVTLDLKVLTTEVGLWTLVAGAGWLYFREYE